jgi:hypothetical protein
VGNSTQNRGNVSGRPENLKPWPKGVSGNPGGRPKSKPLTEELERLLEQKPPKGKGETWAALIAQALVVKASKGDVRAISELANRLEGKPLQAIEIDENANTTLAERIEQARKQVSEWKS